MLVSSGFCAKRLENIVFLRKTTLHQSFLNHAEEGMDKLHRYAKPFADPDRRYAVYQIIHGGAADPALAKHYDALGFGGIVGNIPYTRAFPHDETLWQKTAEGMRAYIKRGMHLSLIHI